MLWVITLSSGIEAKADLRAVEAYNEGIRMLFTENAGQLSDEVVFYSMHPSVVYVLKDGTIYINGVRVSFGSKPRFITGDMPLITKISYFGRNKAISNIPTYRRVVLKEVYPKIDAVLTADGRGVVELQFIVRPGGDPSQIRVETDGDGEVKENGNGLYIVKGGKEVVRVSNLKAYQGAEEVEVKVDVKGEEVRFIVDDWDEKHTLVIDPVITTILASGHYDRAEALTIYAGYVYIAGKTDFSANFSQSRNFFGTSDGLQDAFVSKLDLNLSTHIATAILASTGSDGAHAVIADSSGVYVAGWTTNYSNFAPSRNVFGTTGSTDAFISKLDPSLSIHIATAILTSSGSDEVYDIAIDSNSIYVVGYTGNSSDFAPSRIIFGSRGGSDVFVSKLNKDLSSHITTTILASTGNDGAYDLVIKGDNIYVAGFSGNPSNFAPFRTFFGANGGEGGFISKLSSNLSVHMATVILTSSGNDVINSIAIYDSSIYAVGHTGNYSNFAPGRNVFGSPGWQDAFVSKLTLDLSSHISTAILASDRDDYALGLDVDSSGVYIAGWTDRSSNFGSFRTFLGTPGGRDAFICRMNKDLLYYIEAVILTSSQEDQISYLDINNNNVYVTGYTANPDDFAPSRNVFGTTGSGDAFISKLSIPLNIRENPDKVKNSVDFLKGILIINVISPAYVGFDVYLADGRLIRRVSLGYLPAGRYEYRLKLPKGTYLLKVRVGDEVKTFKGIM